jgi:hypothetical protein
MADFTANFELGINGNTIATTDPGSLTAWNAVTGAPKYDNTQFAHGAQSAKFTAQNQFVAWTGLGNVTDHYGRVYAYWSIFNGGFPRFLTINDSSGIMRAEILLDNARKLIIEDSGEAHNQTGAVAVSLSTWYRIEYHVIHSATVGQIEAKLFLDDSASALDTITSPASWNTGASADQFKLGFVASGTVGDVFYGDDVVANAVSYPGPAVPHNASDDYARPIAGRGATW